MFGGINVPRYFRTVEVHLNLKLSLSVRSNFEGKPTLIASDLSKLIFILEILPYALNSCKRLGRETSGLVSENNMSSAYAAILCCESPRAIPVMSGLARIVHRKGSNDRAKRSGDRGQP